MPRRTDESFRKMMQDPVPRNIRKAERAGVVVDENALTFGRRRQQL